LRNKFTILALLLLLAIPLATGGCSLLMLPFKILTIPLQLLPLGRQLLPLALMFAEVEENTVPGASPTVVWEVASSDFLDEEIDMILGQTKGKVIFFAAAQVQTFGDIADWEEIVLCAAPDGARVRGVLVDGAGLAEDPQRVHKLQQALRNSGAELIVRGELSDVPGVQTSPTGEYFQKFQQVLKDDGAPVDSSPG